MNKNSILYTLKINNVKDSDISIFKEKLKDANFTTTDCNNLIKEMGYSGISFLENIRFNQQDIILQIISLIREQKDYQEAAQLIKDNNISLSYLATNTVRISMMDLAQIADIYKDKF